MELLEYDSVAFPGFNIAKEAEVDDKACVNILRDCAVGESIARDLELLCVSDFRGIDNYIHANLGVPRVLWGERRRNLRLRIATNIYWLGLLL